MYKLGKGILYWNNKYLNIGAGMCRLSGEIKLKDVYASDFQCTFRVE